MVKVEKFIRQFLLLYTMKKKLNIGIEEETITELSIIELAMDKFLEKQKNELQS